LILLVILYSCKERYPALLNGKILEHLENKFEGANLNFDIGEIVYFKTDINPVEGDTKLCATAKESSRGLIVKAQVCSINNGKALLKYLEIINPNRDEKCKDKFNYTNIKQVPTIRRTANGRNNRLNQSEQEKYIGGVKPDGTPQCGISGKVYERKGRWAQCANSDQCAPGLYCREGDRRCMDDNDCVWASANDRTYRNCTRMPKEIDEESFPTEVDLTRLYRTNPIRFDLSDEKQRNASENNLLQSYYNYDTVASNSEKHNNQLEKDLVRDIRDYANQYVQGFNQRSIQARELVQTVDNHYNRINPMAERQLSRQNNDARFISDSVNRIIDNSSARINSSIDKNKQIVISNINNIVDRNLNNIVNRDVSEIENDPDNVKSVENAYNSAIDMFKRQIDNRGVHFNAKLEDIAKKDLQFSKNKLPREDLSNYKGVLVRTYNSSDNNPNSQRGQLVDESIVPAINYFMTNKSDSFFTPNKSNSLRYLEFFGHIKLPVETEILEFNIQAGSGVRFYFGAELLIDEYNSGTKVDHYTRVLYGQPNALIPYKIIAYEGADNTNSHLILKWRINRKGIFNVVPSANFQLPNLKYDN
jgi:hypothetical protein